MGKSCRVGFVHSLPATRLSPRAVDGAAESRQPAIRSRARTTRSSPARISRRFRRERRQSASRLVCWAGLISVGSSAAGMGAVTALTAGAGRVAEAGEKGLSADEVDPGAQVGGEVRGGRIAAGGVLLQAAQDDLLDASGTWG